MDAETHTKTADMEERKGVVSSYSKSPCVKCSNSCGDNVRIKKSSLRRVTTTEKKKSSLEMVTNWNTVGLINVLYVGNNSTAVSSHDSVYVYYC